MYLTPRPPLRKQRVGNSFRIIKLPSPFTERVPDPLRQSDSATRQSEAG